MARSEWGRQIVEIGSKQFSKARDAAYPHAREVRVRLATIKSSRKTLSLLVVQRQHCLSNKFQALVPSEDASC